MNAVVDMAKAHLQNVVAKIQELEAQKEILQGEIEKLKVYLENGSNAIQQVSSDLAQ